MTRFATALLATLLTTTPLASGLARATAPIQPASAASQGVAAYPADYFAAGRPTTAWDMILRLPGFIFDPGAQVRGFAGAAGNVLIDGERPTTKQDGLDSILTRIPARQVVRIDVISGSAPGIDMQGHTVMANVILKHDGGGQAVVSLANKVALSDGRELPAADLEWSQRSSGHTFEAAFNGGGFVDDGSGPGPHTQIDGTGAQVYAAHLWTHAGGEQSTLTSAYEQPLAGGKFRINGLVQLTNYIDHEADTATVPSTGGDDTYKDDNANLNGEIGVHYNHDLGAKGTIEVLAIQQLAHYHEQSVYAAVGDDEFFSINNLNGESIGRATVRYNVLPTLTLQTAMEGAYNTQTTATAYTVNGAPQPLPAADERVAETRGDFTLSSTWTPSPRYTLEAGVRLEDSSVMATGDVQESKTLFYPKPRVVFTWSPDAVDQVRLRGEREVGQLDFGAFAASGSLNVGGLHAGNPNVLPQQAWVIEGAYERKFWTDGDATVTVRHSQIEDAVDRICVASAPPSTATLMCSDPHATSFFDEGGNLPRGSENDLVAALTLPLDRLGLKHAQFKTTATWRDARVTDPVTLTERPQSGVHPLEWDAHLTQDIAALQSTWGVDFVNGWTEHDYRFDEIDVFHYGARFNLFYEYKPTATLKVRLQAINVFSRGFQRSISEYYDPATGAPLPRNISPTPALVDYRLQQFGTLLNLSVRRTFG